MSFNKRKQWEGMFEDGVIVEGIETGEAPSALLTEVSMHDDIACYAVSQWHAC